MTRCMLLKLRGTGCLGCRLISWCTPTTWSSLLYLYHHRTSKCSSVGSSYSPDRREERGTEAHRDYPRTGNNRLMARIASPTWPVRADTPSQPFRLHIHKLFPSLFSSQTSFSARNLTGMRLQTEALLTIEALPRTQGSWTHAQKINQAVELMLLFSGIAGAIHQKRLSGYKDLDSQLVLAP